MTTTPVEQQRVHDGLRQFRQGLDALDLSGAGAGLTLDQLLKSPELEKLLKKRDDKNYRKIMLAVGGLAVVIVIIVVSAFTYNQGQNARQDNALQRSEQTINAFRDQLQASNAKLVSMGLPPVEAPLNPTPGSPEQAQLILAAGAAKTVSDFPPQVIERPVTAKLAEASAKGVSDFVALNQGRAPIDPTLVINQVAAYLDANRASLRGAEGARGAQGDPGVPGPPPTAAQITDAFLSAARQNPQLLCAGGGSFQRLTVSLADGGVAQQYGCFGDVTPAPSQPSQEPSSGGGGGQDTGQPAPTPQTSAEPAPTTTSDPLPPTGIEPGLS